jgi:hypothetical protein
MQRLKWFLLSVITLFTLLFVFGILWDIRQACREPQAAIGIMATGGAIMIEPLVLTSALTYTTGYGQQYGFYTSTNTIQGELLEVYIDYAVGISTTTDLTITCLGLVSEVLLVKADTATDAIWRPRVLPVLNTAVVITPTMALPYYLSGRVVAAVAETSGVAPGAVYLKYRR